MSNLEPHEPTEPIVFDPTEWALDAAGEPLRRWRDDESPGPRRFHEVPLRNMRGDIITETVPVRAAEGERQDESGRLVDSSGELVKEERVVYERLPLDDPRVAEALAEYGLYVEGTVIVGVDRETVDALEGKA